jgi:hypothetical protein
MRDRFGPGFSGLAFLASDPLLSYFALSTELSAGSFLLANTSLLPLASHGAYDGQLPLDSL